MWNKILFVLVTLACTSVSAALVSFEERLEWTADIQLKSLVESKRKEDKSQSSSEGAMFLGLSQRITKRTQADVYLSIYNIDNETETYVDNAEFLYLPDEENGGLGVRAGQMILPLGVFSQDDEGFLSSPMHFLEFFDDASYVDAGALVSYTFGKFTVAGGAFSGQPFMAGYEGREERPTVLPHMFKMEWSESRWKIGADYYRHQPFEQDLQQLTGLYWSGEVPVRAWDFGAIVEVWNQRLYQAAGPTQESMGGFSYIYAKRGPWEAGLRWDYLRHLDLKTFQGEKVGDPRYTLAPRLVWQATKQIALDTEYWYRDLSAEENEELTDYGFAVRAYISLN